MRTTTEFLILNLKRIKIRLCRAAYNQGSYVSIQDFERHCGLKTVRPNAQGSGGGTKAVAIAIKVAK